MKAKACLNCQHVAFTPPLEWKPRSEYDKFEMWDVTKIIRATEHEMKAQCTFNPEWLPVDTGHYCGRWSGGRENHDTTDLIWGTRQERNCSELNEKVQSMRKQLENSRRISASRLARLKKSNGKPAEQEVMP